MAQFSTTAAFHPLNSPSGELGSRSVAVKRSAESAAQNPQNDEDAGEQPSCVEKVQHGKEPERDRQRFQDDHLAAIDDPSQPTALEREEEPYQSNADDEDPGYHLSFLEIWAV